MTVPVTVPVYQTDFWNEQTCRTRTEKQPVSRSIFLPGQAQGISARSSIKHFLSSHDRSLHEHIHSLGLSRCERAGEGFWSISGRAGSDRWTVW